MHKGKNLWNSTWCRRRTPVEIHLRENENGKAHPVLKIATALSVLTQRSKTGKQPFRSVKTEKAAICIRLALRL